MKRLYKNWAYLIFSSAFSTVVNFFAFIYLAKKLSVDDYGIFNALIATITIFTTLAVNVAAGTVVNREIVSQPNAGKSIFLKTVRIRIISFLLAGIALIIYKILTKSDDKLLLISLIVLLLSNVSWELFEQIAFGYFLTKYSTILNILGSVLWFVIVFFIPPDMASLTLLFIVYVLIMLMKSICYFLIEKPLLDHQTENSQVPSRSILKMSIPYFWMRAIGTFSEQIPILLLEGYSGSTEVAYYSVGAKFVIPITMMLTTGVSALFPFLTKLYQENQESYKKKVAMGFSFVFIFGSTLAALLTLTSSSWLIWIMGEKYISSVEAFNYQVWLAVCLGFDLILSMVFSSSYKQTALAVITTIDIVILLPILYIALPYGAKGVAMAKLFGALISVAYHMAVVMFVLKIKLNTWHFCFSFLYFLLLFALCMTTLDIRIKGAVFFVALCFMALFRNSPLRSLCRLVVGELKRSRKEPEV